MKGFRGKILHIDLTKNSIEVEMPDESFYRKYLGGSGIGAYYLMKNTKKGVVPLSPENVLVFAVGPLTGANLSGASRHTVTTKSPLTGTIAASEAGGYFGPELKFAGYDAVVLYGKAKEPVYIHIEDEKVCIKDAKHLWGMSTGDCQEKIREELGDDKVRIAQIGSAGENLVKYACIVNELGHYNGRNGTGAVMGSKNVRAIAVRGHSKPDFYDAEVISQMSKFAANKVVNDEGTKGFKISGTNNCVDAHIAVGGLPSLNWDSGTLEGQENLTYKAWNDDFIKPGTCFACALSCKRSIDGKRTKELDARYGGPEYETVGMCGSNLGITDRLTIAKINELCSIYAMDTISFGGTVGFIMDCFKHNIITKDDTDGLEIVFGNGEAVLELAKLTAQRKGFGNLVAEGTKYIAEKYNANHLAVLVKGKEFPAHMPQVKGSLGIAYAVVPDGVDHVHSEHDGSIGSYPLSPAIKMFGFEKPLDTKEISKEKVDFMWKTQLAYGIVDTSSTCLFLYGFWTIFNFNDLVKAINAATGWDTNLYELMEMSERRLHLFRAFNAREGLTKEDDMLPEKMFKPLKGGITDGQSVSKEDFIKAREYYYDLAGWDRNTGNPERHKLIQFGLEWCLN